MWHGLWCAIYILADDMDIGEKTDLSSCYPERVAEMEKLYTDWRSQMANLRETYRMMIC